MTHLKKVSRHQIGPFMALFVPFDVQDAKMCNILLVFRLEQPIWSLDQLRSAAIEQRVLRPRALAWAIMLQAVPPPNGDLLTSIKTHRTFYNELKARLSMDPRTVIDDDPLSQDDEHPNEVVRYLEKVKEDYLVPLDPELATHMATANISMELFGM
ncbi:TBC1 domain family member 5 [Operophtera brumata]|uniref:TBC1 domain family member 5 n=1 Tax=Operophtera brumata TaxID=104452 RepID=A0A0L7LQ43_OPEBR|nr:TBC1 domain family member 5 [Operophtera brumata]